MIVRLLCCAATVVAIACPSGTASAVEVRDRLSFNAVNVNPWTGGPAFAESWTYDDIRASLDVTVPTVGLTPTALLSQFLGVPEIGFARLGGTLAGSAGLDFGFAVNGGRLNVLYPGQARVDFATVDTDAVRTLLPTRTTASFLPGLDRVIVGQSTTMSGLYGQGYDPGVSLPGFAMNVFQDPTFATSFPNAAAWAQFDYDVRAGLAAEAGLLQFTEPFSGDRVCVACVRRELTLSAADSVTLVDVDRNGVEVIGLGRVPAFGQSFALGTGSVTVDYPDVRVEGGLAADGRTLEGGDAKPIVSFSGDLEKLLPFVGAFLRQSIGPFDVTLLGVSGGPIFSLYQDFTVEVLPKLRMVFSRPVEWIRDGVATITSVIEGALDGVFDWRPLAGSAGQDLQVQLGYVPEARVTNETGFALGYTLDVDALRVGTPFGDLGPLDVATLTENAAIRLPPIFSETFSLGLPAVVGSTRSFRVVSPVFGDPDDVGLQGLRLESATPVLLGDTLRAHELVFVDAEGRRNTTFANGEMRFVASGLPGVDDSLVFVADDEILVFSGERTFSLGRSVCVFCVDASSAFAAATVLTDAVTGDTLYINRLDPGDFRTDAIDPLADPALLRDATALAALQPVVSVLGDTIHGADFPVPLPATAPLLLAGLAVLAASAGRRRRLDVSERSLC